MNRIMVCGEALIDLVPASAGELLRPVVGGGPLNVAVTAARLGADTSLLTRVSRDAFGDQVVEAITAAGVDLSLVQRGAEPTTLAVAGLAPDGAAAYTFYTGGTADRLVMAPTALPDDLAVASFGTLSMTLEPGASVYATLLRRVAASGRITMLDPNIRPGAIADPDRYRERFIRWLPSVTLLKVSDEDAAWLGQGRHGSGVDDWLAAGVTAVIGTHGADGLGVRTATFEVAVPSRPVEVVDTIGAGDTVHGAILAWLVRQECTSRSAVAALSSARWRDAIAYAARAAAVTVSRVGADPPWAADIE